MAWNGLRTWAAGEVLTAANLITYINDNLSYLMNPNKILVESASGTFTTTSTSYANVDATTSTTLTTFGGPVLIGFSGTAYLSGVAVATIAITLNGTAYPIAATLNTTNDERGYLSGHRLWAPSSGTHTVALQWKTTSGTLTMNKALIPFQFWAIEL